MSSWKEEQVLIVGGGIGGLTAALTLARQGIPSQLIEQAAAASGEQNEERIANRLDQQNEELERLIKIRDARQKK